MSFHHMFINPRRALATATLLTAGVGLFASSAHAARPAIEVLADDVQGLRIMGSDHDDRITVIPSGGQVVLQFSNTAVPVIRRSDRCGPLDPQTRIMSCPRTPSAPTIVVSSGAGDDALVASAALTDPVFLSGGPGDDTLYGGAGDDLIFGADGEDTIQGNGGRDQIHGGEDRDIVTPGPGIDDVTGDAGSDIIDLRDGEPDTADCGTNPFPAPWDFVAADLKDASDAALKVRGCEAVSRANRREKPHVAIQGTRLRVGKNAAIVKLRCPGAAAATCRGTLTVRPVTGGRVTAARRFVVGRGITRSLRLRIDRARVRRYRGRTVEVQARQAGAFGPMTTTQPLIVTFP